MLENPDDKGRGAAGFHHGLYHRRTPLVPQINLAFRQIAVEVRNGDSGSICLNAAIHLARASDSTVLIFGVVDQAGEVATGAEGEAPDRARDGSPLEMWLHNKMDVTSGLSFEWHPLTVNDLAHVVGFAKLADLTVLSRQSGGLTPDFKPEDVALNSGRPILLMPPKLRHPTIGQNVIIAWDGSREAARALHDAMPLMRDARHICVLEIDRVASKLGYPDADFAAAFLERHGFNATVSHEAGMGDAVADVVFDQVVRTGADLLVAGLYRHSPTREAIFGGMSRDILRATPVATLLSH